MRDTEMYLSRLRVEVGPDPAREYPGQQWLRNLYHVHQRLCMAFPSGDRRPEGMDGDQVHVRRGPDAGFLFRIDPGRDGRPVILVQSALKPAWECAFYNARHFLVDPGPNRNPWEVKAFDPPFKVGQRLRFRLLANPTKKIDTIRQEERQRCTKEELRQIEGRNGRRVPVPNWEELSAWRQENPKGDERTFISLRLLDWLEQKAEPAGFSLENAAVQPGYAYFKKPEAPEQRRERQSKDTGRRRSARYDGVLVVTDPARFRETLIRGIGSGKAFGFGLLSVAPCPAPPPGGGSE